MWRSSKNKLPSPQERLDLLLLGLSGRESVKDLCAQAGVSRELFYRWMRQLRKTALKTLESKAPGPKAVREETAPKDLLKARERIRKLEAKVKELRKERDHEKQVSMVAKRIIRRQGWDEAPKKTFKKNGKRRRRRGRHSFVNGKRSASTGPQSGSLPDAGESTEARTGDGREERSESREGEQ